MTHQSEMARTTGNGNVDGAQKSRATAPESTLWPPVDIYETKEGITLQADMPGVSKERLNLRVEGTSLLVEGAIEIAPQAQMQALHAEVRANVYRRSFVLSNELESTKIDANLKDGLLTVRIPKRAELQPRRIQVRTG